MAFCFRLLFLTMAATSSHASAVTEKYWQWKKDETMVDFYINVGEHSIPCHKGIVSASAAAISPDEECTSFEVTINIPIYIIELALQFFYLGHTDITINNVHQMIRAAQIFESQNLKEACNKIWRRS